MKEKTVTKSAIIPLCSSLNGRVSSPIDPPRGTVMNPTNMPTIHASIRIPLSGGGRLKNHDSTSNGERNHR